FWAPPEDFPFWPQPVTTDKDGRFTLRGIPRNRGVGVQVRDDRFACQVLAIPPQDKDRPREVALALAPARRITVTVTYAATAKPVPGARGRVETLDGSLGFGPLRPDERGRGTGTPRMFTLPGSDGRADAKGRMTLNPFLGEAFLVRVSAPDGGPYLTVQKSVSWPKAASSQQVKMRLPRGVVV